MVGTADSVLIREVSLIQSALYREVPLYRAVPPDQLALKQNHDWLYVLRLAAEVHFLLVGTHSYGMHVILTMCLYVQLHPHLFYINVMAHRTADGTGCDWLNEYIIIIQNLIML